MLVLTEIATYFGEKKRTYTLSLFCFFFFFFRTLLCFPAARLSVPEWIELSAETEQCFLQPIDAN